MDCVSGHSRPVCRLTGVSFPIVVIGKNAFWASMGIWLQCFDWPLEKHSCAAILPVGYALLILHSWSEHTDAASVFNMRPSVAAVTCRDVMTAGGGVALDREEPFSD